MIWYAVLGDKPYKLLRVPRVFLLLVTLFWFYFTWQILYVLIFQKTKNKQIKKYIYARIYLTFLEWLLQLLNTFSVVTVSMIRKYVDRKLFFKSFFFFLCLWLLLFDNVLFGVCYNILLYLNNLIYLLVVSYGITHYCSVKMVSTL